MGSTILVVDDETDTADVLGAILGMHFPGAEIRVAYRGETALDLVNRHPPQVAVLDLEMPGMDGEELARTLRSTFADNPPLIIALSGNVRRLSTLEATGIFDRCMSKPTDVASLVRLIGGAAGPQS